jgi:hypothetical protein
MRKISASAEFVIHILEPLMTQKLPSFTARVCKAKASEPDIASDKQNDPNCKQNLEGSWYMLMHTADLSFSKQG